MQRVYRESNESVRVVAVLIGSIYSLFMDGEKMWYVVYVARERHGE